MTVWIWMDLARAAECDPAQIAQVAETMRNLFASYEPYRMAADALAKACPGTPVGDLGGRIAAMPRRAARPTPEHTKVKADTWSPDAWAEVLAVDRSFATSASWIQACPGGADLAARLPTLSRAAARAAVFDQCALEPLFDRGEFIDRDVLLVLPVLAAGALRSSGVAPADVRLIARALVNFPVSEGPIVDPMAPPQPKSGAARASVAIATGELAVEAATQVLDRYRLQLSYCYTRELQLGSTDAGTAEWVVDVGGDRTVLAVTRTQRTLASEGVLGCVESRLRRMVFPAGPATLRVSVSFDHD